MAPPVSTDPIHRRPRLEHGPGIGTEHLVDAEICPDFFDFRNGLLPAQYVPGEDAGRHGTGRGAYDDGKRPLGTRIYLRQRLQDAHLVSGACATSRQDETRRASRC